MQVRQSPSALCFTGRYVQGYAQRRPGFTLIELMIGLVLGLITTLIVMQVLANSEGQRRTTSSGADAQVNGAVALFTLQRDIEAAGYGFSANPNVLGCTVKGQYSSTAVSFTLAPVVITADASGGPDTIQVISSSKSSFSLPLYVSENHPTSVSYFVVQSSLGVSAGDLMLAAPASYDATHWCSLFSVTNTSGSTTTQLSSTTVPHVEQSDAPWNHSGAAVFPTGGYDAGSTIFDMGKLVDHTYTISNSALHLASLSSDAGTPSGQDVTPQIVMLKALYGKDTDGDKVVDTYDTTTPTTAAGWQQVMAVRIAVVARSTQYEKNVVTTSNPTWDVGTTGTSGLSTSTCNGTSKCLTLQVGGSADTTWKHYRYKVYDTVVPLRNILWNS